MELLLEGDGRIFEVGVNVGVFLFLFAFYFWLFLGLVCWVISDWGEVDEVDLSILSILKPKLLTIIFFQLLLTLFFGKIRKR